MAQSARLHASQFAVVLVLVFAIAHVARAERPAGTVEQNLSRIQEEKDSTSMVNASSSSLAALANATFARSGAAVASETRHLDSAREGSQALLATGGDKKCGKAGKKLQDKCGGWFGKKENRVCEDSNAQCVGVMSGTCECDKDFCANDEKTECVPPPQTCEEIELKPETGASKNDCKEMENAAWSGGVLFFGGKCKCDHGYCYKEEEQKCQSIKEMQHEDEEASKATGDTERESNETADSSGTGKGEASGSESEDASGDGDDIEDSGRNPSENATKAAELMHSICAASEDVDTALLVPLIKVQSDWSETQAVYRQKYAQEEAAFNGDLIDCLEKLQKSKPEEGTQSDYDKLVEAIGSRGVDLFKRVGGKDKSAVDEGSGETDEEGNNEDGSGEDDDAITVEGAGSSDVDGLYVRTDLEEGSDDVDGYPLYKQQPNEDVGSLIQKRIGHSPRNWEPSSGNDSGNEADQSGNESDSGPSASLHEIVFYDRAHSDYQGKPVWFIQTQGTNKRRYAKILEEDAPEGEELVPPSDGWAVYKEKGSLETKDPAPRLYFEGADESGQDSGDGEDSEVTEYTASDPCREWNTKPVSEKRCKDWEAFGCRWRINPKDGALCYHQRALKYKRAEGGDDEQEDGVDDESDDDAANVTGSGNDTDAQ